jgi:hypothetical protein
MTKETLAKANKEKELVRMSELLWVIKKLHHITVK